MALLPSALDLAHGPWAGTHCIVAHRPMASARVSGQGGSVGRLRDWPACGAGSVQPCLDGLLDLGDGLVGGWPVSGAQWEIGNLGDPELVFVAPEHLDSITRVPRFSSNDRSYLRTRLMTCLTW